MKAFVKKEWMEMTRTGRLFILFVVFLVFGIMNPAIAKLTPKLLEMMKDQMADTGITVGSAKVNAMSSWTQFYKNAPMVLIITVLMFSGVLIGEYQRGTLVQVVTKGLSRVKIMLSKMLTVYGTWTVMFAVYFGVTLGYTKYFWGKDKAENLILGVTAYWLFGMLILSFLMLFSAISENVGQVLLGCGGCVLFMVFANYIPKCKEYLPLRLMEGLSAMNGGLGGSDYTAAFLVAGALTIISSILAVVLFNKRSI